MIIWRFSKAKHVPTAFDGEGARQHPGRWNLRGTAIVYTAGSQALGQLEVLVGVDSEDAPTDYFVIPCTVPDDVLIETVALAALPSNWRRFPGPEALQIIGSTWVTERRSAILRVPSAVVPAEYNYLINPAHPDFARLQIGAAAPVIFDPRLFP